MSKESVINEFHDYGIFFPSGIIWLGDEVDPYTAGRAIKNIHMLERVGKDIKILINNTGGEASSMLAVYDAIEACNRYVTGIVYGEACSAASVILQACDLRVMSPRSLLMIHYGTSGENGGKHPKIARAWVEYEKGLDKTMEQIYLTRIKEKHPSFTLKQLQSKLLFDTIFTPEQAVDIGLADAIIGVNYDGN